MKYYLSNSSHAKHEIYSEKINIGLDSGLDGFDKNSSVLALRKRRAACEFLPIKSPEQYDVFSRLKRRRRTYKLVSRSWFVSRLSIYKNDPFTYFKSYFKLLLLLCSRAGSASRPTSWTRSSTSCTSSSTTCSLALHAPPGRGDGDINIDFYGEWMDYLLNKNRMLILIHAITWMMLSNWDYQRLPRNLWSDAEYHRWGSFSARSWIPAADSWRNVEHPQRLETPPWPRRMCGERSEPAVAVDLSRSIWS